MLGSVPSICGRLPEFWSSNSNEVQRTLELCLTNKKGATGRLDLLVGVRGFEPPTPASRRQCSTRLSYTPTVARDLYPVDLMRKRDSVCFLSELTLPFGPAGIDWSGQGLGLIKADLRAAMIDDRTRREQWQAGGARQGLVAGDDADTPA